MGGVGEEPNHTTARKPGPLYTSFNALWPPSGRQRQESEEGEEGDTGKESVLYIFTWLADGGRGVFQWRDHECGFHFKMLCVCRAQKKEWIGY